MSDYYYRISADGSYWSTEDVSFVPFESIPADIEIIPLRDIEELRITLKFYAYGLGGLDSPEDMAKQFEEAVNARLDSFAREKQYDNMDKARLASLTQDFKADGDYANQVYDRVWLAAFDLEERIRGGTLSAAEALSRLPAVEWPPVIK